jgi:hypothetical protein
VRKESTGVAQVAVARDDLPRLAREQAVALGVVRLVADQGHEQPGQVLGVHLRVARHHGHQGGLRALLERGPIPGDDGRPHAAVALVPDHHQARPQPAPRGQQQVAGPVRGGVVHHDDAVHEGGHGVEHAVDELRLVEGGHDHDDPAPLEHSGRYSMV